MHRFQSFEIVCAARNYTKQKQKQKQKKQYFPNSFPSLPQHSKQKKKIKKKKINKNK